jgi:hypothetical protein
MAGTFGPVTVYVQAVTSSRSPHRSMHATQSRTFNAKQVLSPPNESFVVVARDYMTKFDMCQLENIRKLGASQATFQTASSVQAEHTAGAGYRVWGYLCTASVSQIAAIGQIFCRKKWR